MRCPGVYIFSEGPGGPCKVGWASDAQDRFQRLQTGNPRPLVPEMVLTCPHAQSLERLIHAELADKRLRGEWFAVTPAEAEAALDRALARGCDAFAPKRADPTNTERQRAYRARKKESR